MSSSFIWLAVILTLVSAFVAYLGDLLGRHVGKRKIKLFGLRPRDSAIVVTSFTGGVITLITIVVLLLGNASLQNMAKSADEVIRLQAEAKAKIAESQEVIETADRAIQIARDEQAGLETELKELNEQMTETTAEKAVLQSENSRLDLDLAEKTAQEKVLAGQLKDLSARRDRLTKEIDANSSYILEQETVVAKLRTEATTLASTVKLYREGDIVVTEGTGLASEYLPATLSDIELKGRIAELQREVKLPAGVDVQWPSSLEIDVAVQSIQKLRAEGRASVILEAKSNTLYGDPVTVTIRVEDAASIYEVGETIHMWRLESPLTEKQAEEAAKQILPQISEEAIKDGSEPLMGDRRITSFDSLSLAQFIADLASAEAPAYIVFRATQEIGPLDPILADVNLSWIVLPTGDPVPDPD